MYLYQYISCMKCFYRKSFFLNTYELSKDFNLNKNFYRNTIFHSGCQSFIYIWLEWSKNPKIIEFSILFLSIVYGWWKFFHKIFERNHSIITISFFKKKLFLQFTSRIFQVVYQFMVTFALFHSLRVSKSL